MTGASAEKVFQAFENLNVLVIGDIMIDAYIWGNVHRISPEAPVPVVDVLNKEKRPGGAANVALNIQAMGATPVLCGITGNDNEGDTFLQLMEERGLSRQFIFRSDNRSTTMKERILSGGQQMLRIDSESRQELSKEEEDRILDQLLPHIERFEVIIFEDYDKGVLPPTLIKKVIDKANQHNVPTVVDPKKDHFFHYNGATLFKPNLKELVSGLKLDKTPDTVEALQEAVKGFKERLNVKSLVITLSEKGIYIDHNNQQLHLPAFIREISDVSGAGDTVISLLSLCLALNLPAELTANLANLGGGLVCEHVGVVPVDKNELMAEAQKHGLFPE